MLARSACRDQAAFAELYERYARQVFWYALSRTGSEEDAADLTQHVFLRAYEALPQYQERGTVGAWLFRIARNAATDTYRRRGRDLPWSHVDETVLRFQGPGPEEVAIEREALNELRLLVAQLDPEKQELLALRMAARLTTPEIAAVMGKSEAAVKKQLQRIIQSLRERYHER
jgi:RNA polymerase sigma-70 factor (ECF subfamily)